MLRIVIKLNLGPEFIDPAYVSTMGDDEIIDLLHEDIMWALDGAEYEVLRGNSDGGGD